MSPSRFQAFIGGMMTGALVMLWHCMRLIVSRQVRRRDCRKLLGMALITEIFSRGPHLVGKEHPVRSLILPHELTDTDLRRAIERRGVDDAAAGRDIALKDLPESGAGHAGLQVEGQEGAKAERREPLTDARQGAGQHIWT